VNIEDFDMIRKFQKETVPVKGREICSVLRLSSGYPKENNPEKNEKLVVDLLLDS